jgi:hypothetical protein
LGVAGLGPQQEEWILEREGIPSEPEAVIWFFFTGNDLDDALYVKLYRDQGIQYYDQKYADFQYPSFYMYDVLRIFFHKSEVKKPSLPGIQYKTREGDTLLWFHPHYLRSLTRTTKDWESHGGWEITKGILKDVRDALSLKGIEFLVLCAPTKAQVYLPYVAGNAALIHRMSAYDLDETPSQSPQDFLQKALENRDSLERMLDDFCRKESIDFISLTPYLENLAKSGIAAYFSGDTHWNPLGQRSGLKPILHWLEEKELLNTMAHQGMNPASD